MQPDLISDQGFQCSDLCGYWFSEWHWTSHLTSLCLVQQIALSVWFELIQLFEHY